MNAELLGQTLLCPGGHCVSSHWVYCADLPPYAPTDSEECRPDQLDGGESMSDDDGGVPSTSTRRMVDWISIVVVRASTNRFEVGGGF